MTYDRPIEWDTYTTTKEDENGECVEVVDTTTTPRAIVAEMKELDAEIFAATGYHEFKFVAGDGGEG